MRPGVRGIRNGECPPGRLRTAGYDHELFDLNANGSGEAYIEIAFSASEAQRGTLDLVTIDAAATSVSFDFEPTWLAVIGPVHFDLRRVR